MKVAIALLTKDHPELTRRSIEPLLQPDKFDLFQIDNSVLPFSDRQARLHTDIAGGPDAAIVYALTEMLKHPYRYVGIIEQDVLLSPDWFDPTMALFERGTQDGLEVGAVSARSYEDRILVQRDGYAVMHNLGAGMTIFSRRAARAVLDDYRTGHTFENRQIFSQLSGLDIGRWWAFRGGDHPLSADWHFNTALARKGLASLALTPNLVTMLDQDIDAQGLKYADGCVDSLRDNAAFDTFKFSTSLVREQGVVLAGVPKLFLPPHHLDGWTGEWRFKWNQGLGPFAYVGAPGAALGRAYLGDVTFLVSGGKNGGRIKVHDLESGYIADPELPPEGEQRTTLTLPIPGGCQYRAIELTAIDDGVTVYGVHCAVPQPRDPTWSFDYSRLPPVMT